ncbi:hypothetical protein MMC30_002939 [Trapelia coarctata]|nr:hypothetical protein [Trapelia coarctata]
MLNLPVLSTSPVQDIPWFWTFFSLSVCFYLFSIISVRFLGPKAHLVGLRSAFEPRVIANYRFFKDAASVINEGYAKVIASPEKRNKPAHAWQFQGASPFRFVRNDADIVVLPVKYVDEIRSLPNEIANPTLAHAHNLLGRHTDMDIILRSNLHFRMIQAKLTPSLGALTQPMQDELNYAMEQDFPACDDEWVTIQPYHLILGLVARISGRVFVGLPLCRSERWLEISTQFTENVFVTVVFLRLLPTWLHPVASLFLPSRWRGSGYVKDAKRFLIPEIKHRQSIILAHEKDGSNPELPCDNLLSWMMECAQGDETDPAHLAHLEIVISLASIHTSQMNAVHVLYDLASYPEYVQPIRDEIRSVAEEDGGWQKTSFAKLRKLDSFLKESQRFNPPTLLSYHRLMTKDHTLTDGTLLAKGSHICMPVSAIQNDPSVTPNPDVFDGFRYEKLRQREGEGHLHQFATTENKLLNFGHGKNACPGRFFASLEIKTILVRLIMNYDFRFVDGEGRPANKMAHEFVFPNPDGKLLVKARAEKDRLML